MLRAVVVPPPAGLLRDRSGAGDGRGCVWVLLMRLRCAAAPLGLRRGFPWDEAFQRESASVPTRRAVRDGHELHRV